MRLEKLAAFGEIVSSFAIVATLAYLVVQTREMSNQTEQMALQTSQTNLALNANTQATVLFSDLNYLLSGMEYTQLIPGGDQQRSEDDRSRIFVLTAAAGRIREFLWFQKRAGLVDDDTWESYLNSLVGPLRRDPDYRLAWQQLSESFNPDFYLEIENRISE